MPDHVSEWLGAYHDGELHGARLRQVEQHLAGCALCQAELAGLRNLSELLNEPAPLSQMLPSERFAANLALSLPRRPEQTQRRDALNIGWWMVPVALLSIWLFVNIAITLSTIASLGIDSGLFDGSVAWMQESAPHMEWFQMALRLSGDNLGGPEHALLSVLNTANVYLAELVKILLPQVILAGAYLGWLFTWWFRHQSLPAQNAGE